jgi:hypothetical protein
MSILVDVAKELAGMFLADARLTLATPALVTIVAGLSAAHIEPSVCGALLLLGSLAILVEAVVREARRPSVS